MSSELIKRLYAVWSQDDLSSLDLLIAERYTIFSDPGDAWEGQTLDRAAYRSRLMHSRMAFPDLVFEVLQSVHERDRVAVTWRASGTQLGNLGTLPASGRRLTFAGQTLYALQNDRVVGHWQTIDRLGFIQQLQSAH